MKQHLHLHWKVNTDQTYLIALDDDFSPFEDTSPFFTLRYKSFTFLGGEPHFQILPPDGEIQAAAPLIITQRYRKIDDIFKIVLAVDAARRLGFKNISLILPYFPAARQDRVCNPGEPLTVKVFTDMINGLGLDAVHILSPHSEVTPALLNNVVVHDELIFAKKIVEEDRTNTVFNIVCPDAGAGKRVGKIATYLAKQFPTHEFRLIRCEKERDVRDGSLKEFIVQADDLERRHTIIFDDIVAMGGTFLGLAEKLREKGAGRLSIFTSHADCLQGLEKLAGVFDAVYTTDSKVDPHPQIVNGERVVVFPFTIPIV